MASADTFAHGSNPFSSRNTLILNPKSNPQERSDHRTPHNLGPSNNG